jgi:hypothetical protein
MGASCKRRDACISTRCKQIEFSAIESVWLQYRDAFVEAQIGKIGLDGHYHWATYHRGKSHPTSDKLDSFGYVERLA